MSAKFKAGDRVIRGATIHRGPSTGTVQKVQYHYQINWEDSRDHNTWWIPERDLSLAPPKPKFKVGDKVVINPGQLNEERGEIVESPDEYYVRLEGEYWDKIEHPVGPYEARRLHPAPNILENLFKASR
jgi:hypothetical protein